MLLCSSSWAMMKMMINLPTNVINYSAKAFNSGPSNEKTLILSTMTTSSVSQIRDLQGYVYFNAYFIYTLLLHLPYTVYCTGQTCHYHVLYKVLQGTQLYNMEQFSILSLTHICTSSTLFCTIKKQLIRSSTCTFMLNSHLLFIHFKLRHPIHPPLPPYVVSAAHHTIYSQVHLFVSFNAHHSFAIPLYIAAASAYHLHPIYNSNWFIPSLVLTFTDSNPYY